MSKTSVKCNWDNISRPHAKECDGKLHEALAKLLTNLHSVNNSTGKFDPEKHKDLRRSFGYILGRLHRYGARIPAPD